MGGLGASWGAVARFWGTSLETLWRRWAQHGPSWQQVAPKMGHVSAKMAMLGSVWEALVEFWEHFWSILADALDIKKPSKTLGFYRFLEVLGGWMGWLRHVGDCFGRCWLQDGVNG